MILLRGEFCDQRSLASCFINVIRTLLLTVLVSERFNLVDCLHEYRVAVNIHGDDVLAHNNWEISESWLQRYKYVFRSTCTTFFLTPLL